MQLQSILVDDEKNSRKILRNYLSKYCLNVSIVNEAENINQALELIKNHKIDLVFLDVEMPFGNAFDFIEQASNINFEIIFVTAYSHYAKDALNSHAAYYLTKPISIEELIKAVNYVSSIKEKELIFQNKLLVPKTKFKKEKITIPTQKGFEILLMKEILYAKADDNYTIIYLEDNSTKLVSKTLKHFQDILSEYGFARIHKSYLVNIDAVVKYQKGKGGTVILENGKELSVSASQKTNLLAYFK